MADTRDEVQMFILRNYDRDLAASGFECVMIKGSHYAGTTITSDNEDVEYRGTVKTYQSGSAEVVVEGNTYNFDSLGKGIGNSYRLMLVEDKERKSSEESLKSIAEYLEAINDTLAEYISTVDRKIKEAKQAADEAKETVDSMESTIEDLDERVTALEDENNK